MLEFSFVAGEMFHQTKGFTQDGSNTEAKFTSRLVLHEDCSSSSSLCAGKILS